MNPMARADFKIRGMDCAEEVATLRSECGRLAGIDRLDFDVLHGRMTVTFDPRLVQPTELVAAVGRTGMRAEPWQDDSSTAPQSGWTRWGRTIMTAASGVLLIVGFLLHAAIRGGHAALLGHREMGIPLVVRVLYLTGGVCGAWYVGPKAWAAIKRLRPDMNLLMVVAILGAIFIGEYSEAATVAFLFALSLSLESWSVGRARRAIEVLLAMTPTRARLVSGTRGEELVDVNSVSVGARVLVKPGEKIPLDGKIVAGQTTVNQAPITGESMPVPKSTGDEIFAGTLNEDGAIEFETTKSATDTTLARILRMVSEAQGRRAPSEQWVEQFAHIYTPVVMLLAILVAIVPPLLGGSWSQWFYASLVLLVIACPCALVISTPVSIVASLAAAARNGVLIKGGRYAELPAHLKAVALDKTGTLTEGHPEVQQIVPMSGHSERELLEIAASIESRSEHPLAKAIVRRASAASLTPLPADDFQAIKGKGASAVLNGRPVWIGSHRFLEERGQETPDVHERLEEMSRAGLSVVVVGNSEHVCGFIGVGDRLRPAAKDAVAALRAAGIERIIMLTGDNAETAAVIGYAAGVDEVRAELLPEEKVTAIEGLVQKHGAVAMVGDGVNDAPAMARSSLGIAMGAIGTDVAIETADIALMSDDLGHLAWLIRHSWRTLAIIRQNVVSSLSIKALFFVLTMLGHASLWGAIAADTGVSLLVVLNALRLLGNRNN